MKILFIETLGDGGIAHYTYNLVNAIQDRDINVEIITSYKYEIKSKRIKSNRLFFRIAFLVSQYFPSLEKETPLPTIIRRVIKLIEFPINIVQVIQIAERKGVRLFHFQTIHLLELFMAFLLKLYGFHIVYTIHNLSPGHKAINPIQKILYSYFYRYCDALVIHSESCRKTATDLYTIPSKKIYVIPHGDYAFFVPKEKLSKSDAKMQLGLNGKKTILFFGAIRKNKGLQDLIAAFPDVQKRVPNSMLMIIGEPFHDYPHYREQMRRLGIQDSVYEHLTYIPNEKISDFFYAADIVVLPYHEISQSGVLQIAYAFGKPVIATIVGGFPEVIEDGKNGFLVPPGQPSELSGKIVELLICEDLMKQMGTASLEKTKDFSWKSIAALTEIIYRHLQ